MVVGPLESGKTGQLGALKHYGRYIQTVWLARWLASHSDKISCVRGAGVPMAVEDGIIEAESLGESWLPLPLCLLDDDRAPLLRKWIDSLDPATIQGSKRPLGKKVTALYLSV
jgi:hypothetical protein